MSILYIYIYIYIYIFVFIFIFIFIFRFRFRFIFIFIFIYLVTHTCFKLGPKSQSNPKPQDDGEWMATMTYASLPA